MSLADEVSKLLRTKGVKLATAESCTGGMIAAAITDLAGSSEVFDRGFVTYSNEAKEQMLGVDFSTLKKYGAVSEQVALEMVAGALKNSDASAAIAVTGIAGPGGGSAEKPVGLVFIAVAVKGGIAGGGGSVTRNLFEGDRAAIRAATRDTAFEQLKQALS